MRRYYWAIGNPLSVSVIGHYRRDLRKTAVNEMLKTIGVTADFSRQVLCSSKLLASESTHYETPTFEPDFAPHPPIVTSQAMRSLR